MNRRDFFHRSAIAAAGAAVCGKIATWFKVEDVPPPTTRTNGYTLAGLRRSAAKYCDKYNVAVRIEKHAELPVLDLSFVDRFDVRNRLHAMISVFPYGVGPGRIIVRQAHYQTVKAVEAIERTRRTGMVSFINDASEFEECPIAQWPTMSARLYG